MHVGDEMLKSMEHEKLLKEAKALFDTRSYKKSLALYNRVLEEDANNIEALFNAANIFHMRGEISKAIKAFKKVLEVDPDHTDATVSLSVLYNDIGHYDEARKLFNQVNNRVKKVTNTSSLTDEHIDKKFSLKHYETADLYLTYNRFDEALSEFEKSIRLDPTNLEARLKIAKVYAKKGFVNKAHEELVKLKNENPNYLPGRISLGVLYYGRGDVISAQSEWQKVLSLDPVNSEAAMYMNLSKTASETTVNLN